MVMRTGGGPDLINTTPGRVTRPEQESLPHELLYGGKLGHDPLETNQKPPAWLFHDHPTSGSRRVFLMCLQ
jgi:hypothetical protein